MAVFACVSSSMRLHIETNKRLQNNEPEFNVVCILKCVSGAASAFGAHVKHNHKFEAFANSKSFRATTTIFLSVNIRDKNVFLFCF